VIGKGGFFMDEHIVKPIVNTNQPLPTKTEDLVPGQTQEVLKTEEAPQEEKKESRWETKLSPSDPYFMDDPLFYKVADYLGMNSRSMDFNKNKIIEIMNWGRNESPTKDDGDVLLRIKDLESKTGQSPGMSERRYAILYRYIILSKQKSNIEKEMKVWE